jgi:hypothetical protein
MQEEIYLPPTPLPSPFLSLALLPHSVITERVESIASVTGLLDHHIGGLQKPDFQQERDIMIEENTKDKSKAQGAARDGAALS